MNVTEQNDKAMDALMKVVDRSECNPYSARVLNRDDIVGFTVSTAWTTDEGYETAIIDRSGVQPVERYPDKKSAMTGHLKWCEFIRDGSREIVRIGGLAGTIPDKLMTLEINP